MKIIEGMKKIKDLLKKSDDILTKVKTYSAYMSFESPTYGKDSSEQTKQVSEWVQSYEDIMKEILKLRTCINRTNLSTHVTIELGGKQVTKSITEWIYRRKELSAKCMNVWMALTDKNLREGKLQDSMGAAIEAKIIRCYEPKKRDEMIEMYRSEPSKIDSTLEVVNAVTDLME
jgi:transcription initiation factor TFIIIB Brf1 subunit/transcription initiation factor TFIIB